MTSFKKSTRKKIRLKVPPRSTALQSDGVGHLFCTLEGEGVLNPFRMGAEGRTGTLGNFILWKLNAILPRILT
jgi:hypothetical protein